MNSPGKKQADFGFGVRPQKYADDIPVPEYRESGTRQNEIDDMVGFVKGVRDSSLDAYAKIKESGQLGKQESVIYRFLLDRGDFMSLKEISRATGIEINAVSGRVNGMKAKGYIAEGDKRVCKVTGRNIIPVGLA